MYRTICFSLFLLGCGDRFSGSEGPALADTEGSRLSLTTDCWKYDVVDTPGAPGAIDFADYLFVSQFFGTEVDGIVVDFELFTGLSTYFGQTCEAPGNQYSSFVDLLALRTPTVAEALSEEGRLTEEALDGLWDGADPTGQINDLRHPVVTPDGNFEVPAGTMDAVEAYAGQYAETGEAYDARYFEGMVAHGMFDPGMPAMMNAAQRYLGSNEGLQTTAVDWLRAHMPEPGNCEVSCLVVNERTEMPDAGPEFRGDTSTPGFSVSGLDLTCMPGTVLPELFAGESNCDTAYELEHTGVAHATTTCNAAYEVRMACMFTPGARGDCDNATCPATIGFSASSNGTTGATRDGIDAPENWGNVTAVGGFVLGGALGNQTEFLASTDVTAHAIDDDYCTEVLVEGSFWDNFSCAVNVALGGQATTSDDPYGYADANVSCSYTFLGGESNEVSRQLVGCDSGELTAHSSTHNFLEPPEGQRLEAVYQFEKKPRAYRDEISIGTMIAAAEVTTHAASGTSDPWFGDQYAQGGDAWGYTGADAGLIVKGFTGAPDTTGVLGDDGNFIRQSCGFAERDHDLLAILFPDSDFVWGSESDTRSLSAACYSPGWDDYYVNEFGNEF